MKRIWKNAAQKRYKDAFVSYYERDLKGERVFVLDNGKKKFTFESWQMAKQLGWKKCY